MAIELVLQSKQIVAQKIQKFGFIGEMSLNGELRSYKGILLMFKSRGVRPLGETGDCNRNCETD